MFFNTLLVLLMLQQQKSRRHLSNHTHKNKGAQPTAIFQIVSIFKITRRKFCQKRMVQIYSAIYHSSELVANMNPCYRVKQPLNKRKKKGIYVSRTIEQVERKASQFEQCFASTSLLKTQTALPLSLYLFLLFFIFCFHILILPQYFNCHLSLNNALKAL